MHGQRSESLIKSRPQMRCELMMLDEPKKRRRVIDDDDEEEEDDLPLLRALQHLVAGRASEGDSVITIELTLPLSKDHWSGSLRIEFGGKAVEQKVDPVFEDPMHAIESASRAVMSSLSPMAPSPSALIQKKSDDEVSPADEGAVEVSVDGEVETGSMREVAFSGRHPERVLPFWRCAHRSLYTQAPLIRLQRPSAATRQTRPACRPRRSTRSLDDGDRHYSTSPAYSRRRGGLVFCRRAVRTGGPRHPRFAGSDSLYPRLELH